MALVFTAIAVWGLSGVIIAWLLSRHGHNFWLLAFIGLGYGPLLMLIWLRAIEGQDTGSRIFDSGARSLRPNTGWIDVLVGLDGSADSIASTSKVLEQLGSALGRIRLTSVLDHEVFNSSDAFEVDDRRLSYLRQAAVELGFPDAEVSLISGQPDKALRRHAEESGFDLLVVAHRRGAISAGMRGSTVVRLARKSDIPVLIGPVVAAEG